MPLREKRAGAREDSRSGPGMLLPGRIAEIQRRRLLSAMAEVATERGAANVTVAHVVARAGVSRRTFYDLFEDRDDCFMAAFDQALERAAAGVLPAYEAGGSWRERIRAGLGALLAFFDEEPRTARLVVVEALGAGPLVLEARAQILDRLIAAMDEGCAEVRRRREVPPLTAEGVVGAVLSVLHARLLANTGTRAGGRGEGPLYGLLGELMGMIVLPYLGQAVASKELTRLAPRLSIECDRASDGHPLQGLNMRLTYRTLRALAAIGERPGSSNRSVADIAEISDQGQVSKLLARLQDIGLIENTGDGHSRGSPNAWQLTTRGRQVTQAMGV